MSLFRSIASNTAYQIISRLTSSSIGFLIAVIIARHFGVEGYGNYAKVTAFVGLFYLFIDFGFNAVFLQRDDGLKKIKELFVTRLLFSVIIFILVVILSFLLPFNNVTGTGFSGPTVLGIIIFALTLFTEGVVYTASVVFQKTLSYRNLMVSTLLGSATTFLIVCISVFLSLPLIWIFIGFVFGGIVEAITAISLSKVALRGSATSQKQFTLSLVKASLPIALMLVLNLIYFRIDTILLALFKKSQDVAVYDFAYKFFDFLIAVPLYISNTLYPGFITSVREGNLNIKKTIKTMCYFFLASLPVVVLAIVFAPFIAIIKKEFIDSVLVFRILALSLPFFFATSVLQWTLIAKKQQKFLVVVYAVAAVVNIILNIVFIPKYSYISSSIITGASELFVLIILLIKVILQ